MGRVGEESSTISELSAANGGGPHVSAASSRQLELRRGNSAGRVEFWSSEEPACHDVQPNAGQRCQRPSCRRL